MKCLTGVVPCIFNGRGFFQYSFGLMPRNSPITVVVGKPIRVSANKNPTAEDIDLVHSQYVSELTNLYEQYKAKYGNKYLEIEVV